MDKINTEIKKYYKNVSQFFSGFICSMCSPLASNYFEFKDGNFVIRISPNTCRGIYRWYVFSFKMASIFNQIVYPLMEFLKCIKNKLEDPHYALFIIPDTYILKNNEISICFEDPSISDKRCEKICSVELGNFSIKNSFVKNYKPVSYTHLTLPTTPYV